MMDILIYFECQHFWGFVYLKLTTFLEAWKHDILCNKKSISLLYVGKLYTLNVNIGP